MELNTRELDEGDLFGIRAIQSGYFGGVAQSRPSSVAETSSPSPDQSRAVTPNTFLDGSNYSSKPAVSPISSVASFPYEPKHHSPLTYGVTAPNPISLAVPTQRRAPSPLSYGSLRPSDAESSRSVNHDPAINMHLEVPPSPIASSHSSPKSETSERSPQLSSSPFSRSPEQPPQLPFPNDVGSRSPARPVSTQRRPHLVHSQSASIVSVISSDGSCHDERQSMLVDSVEPSAHMRPVPRTRRISGGPPHLSNSHTAPRPRRQQH